VIPRESRETWTAPAPVSAQSVAGTRWRDPRIIFVEVAGRPERESERIAILDGPFIPGILVERGGVAGSIPSATRK